MTDREYQRERLRQARLERLGSNDPRCLFCDEADPACLELHHVSGKAFGDDCIVVCRNCHRKLSDKQREHPPTISKNPNTLECLGWLLLGVADSLELLKVPEQLVQLIRNGGLHLIEYGQLFKRCDGEQPGSWFRTPRIEAQLALEPLMSSSSRCAPLCHWRIPSPHENRGRRSSHLIGC